MSWIAPLIDDYHVWLKENTFVRESSISEWVAIQTPLLDQFNDTVEIMIKKEADKITMTDDGITLDNLSLLGVKLNKGERKDIMDKILFTLGVSLVRNELVVYATKEDFAQKKHNLLSAMMELGHMSVLSSKNVLNIFKEDVKSFLNRHEIIFTPEFVTKGVTGIEFIFDFQVASRDRELVIKSFNSITRQSISAFLFSWEDIKPVRQKLTQKTVAAVAILNDSKPIGPEFIEALQVKEADYILWSDRDKPNAISLLRA
jgi:hypothetical protein